jgi:hypothetical protein
VKNVYSVNHNLTIFWVQTSFHCDDTGYSPSDNYLTGDFLWSFSVCSHDRVENLKYRNASSLTTSSRAIFLFACRYLMVSGHHARVAFGVVETMNVLRQEGAHVRREERDRGSSLPQILLCACVLPQHFPLLACFPALGFIGLPLCGGNAPHDQQAMSAHLGR